MWTPTVLLFDSNGKEQVRLEGYLPNNDFIAALMSGLGRIAFVQKKYADAEGWYGDVVSRFGQSHLAPEAMYWRAVSQYSASHDHTVSAKSQRSFAVPTQRACGRARRFRGYTRK